MRTSIAFALRALTLSAGLAVAMPAFAAEAAGTPPDIVYKKDGTFYRGTVVERDPKGSVTLQLVTGKTITVPMVDVEYAGPAESAPGRKDPKAQSEGTVSGEEAQPKEAEGPHVHAHVTGSRPGLRLHVEGARAQAFAVVGNQVAAFTTSMYIPVCDMPCDVPADPGTYKLGVSKGEDGSVVEAGTVTIPNNDVQLDTKYTSRAVVRGLGWAVSLAGLGLGTYMLVDGIGGAETCDSQGNCKSSGSTTEVVLGTSLMIVGPIVGLVMAGTPDKAYISVRPGLNHDSGPPGSRGTARTMMPALALDGAF